MQNKTFTLALWLLAIITTISASTLLFVNLNKTLHQDPHSQSQDNAQSVDPINPPMIIALEQILEADYKPAVALQVSLGCDIIDPVLSGVNKTNTKEVAMYPTGMGALAYSQLANCSNSTEKTDSIETKIGNDIWVSYGAGDAIISVPKANANPKVSADLMQVLLNNSCAKLDPSVEDATRNPLSPNYKQWAPLETITTDLPNTTADPGPETAVPVLNDPQEPLSPPEGILGPPLPSAPAKPSPLTWPGPRPTSIEAAIPTVDEIGPGCGWAFNMTTPPEANEAAIAKDAQTARENAQAELLAIAADWERAVEDFHKNIEEYQKQMVPWNEYLAEVEDVQAQWDAQVKLLEEWEADNSATEAQLQEYQLLQQEYARAQTQWEEQVIDCEVAAITDGRDPKFCKDLEKPQLLQTPMPAPPQNRPKPELWKPES